MLSVTFVSIDALNAIMLIINMLNVVAPLLVNCKGQSTLSFCITIETVL